MAGIDILASAFSGANAAFLADLYARWASDPASVFCLERACTRTTVGRGYAKRNRFVSLSV